MRSALVNGDEVGSVMDCPLQATFSLCSTWSSEGCQCSLRNRTNGGDEVLARAVNLLIGKAAFETAKRMYPKDLIEHRRGAQVLDRSEPQ
jgi:hypothetical protein